MPFGGDLSKLGALATHLHRLAGVPARVATRGAYAIAELVEHQFDLGVDPYGTPWAPLSPRTMAKGRFAPPLTDTRALRNSVRVLPMPGAGISIVLDPPGLIHQTGGSSGAWRMPARPILPGKTFPPAWRRALDDAKRAAFAEAGDA